MASYKMVFVVNNSLKMGIGKIAAQIGHATLGIYSAMMANSDYETALSEWTSQGEPKVVLKADGGEEELIELHTKAKRDNLKSYIVADAGRTQIASGSLTVLSLFGQSDRVDAIVGDLALVK